MWATRVSNAPCAHCWTLEEEHTEGKCLFQPTCYRPLGEFAVRTIINYYGYNYHAPYATVDFEGSISDPGYCWVLVLTAPGNRREQWRPAIEIEMVRRHLVFNGLV